MDASGITITSATGDININATAGNVTLSAGLGLMAKGMTASLQGTTTASVQATTVMIN
jgi:hypothetical protein